MPMTLPEGTSRDTEGVSEMTTEQHAWASSRVPATDAWRLAPPVCGCGQELDVCARAHCPRCGTALSHAA